MSKSWDISTTLSALAPEIQKQLAEIQKYFREVQERMEASFSDVAENLKRFNDGFPEQVGILANYGWFISSWHTPLAAIYPVADLFRGGETDAGHRQLCRHFADIRVQIESDLTERFPTRSQILKKAFGAHDQGHFELSIPVFLAQADGIAREVLGVSIYTRRPDHVRRMDEVITTIAGEGLDESLLRLVLEALPLTASSGSDAYRLGELNRHEVLHGIDTNYPSELNSWRSISWLQYASHFHEVSDWSNHRHQQNKVLGSD